MMCVRVCVWDLSARQEAKKIPMLPPPPPFTFAFWLMMKQDILNRTRQRETGPRILVGPWRTTAPL